MTGSLLKPFDNSVSTPLLTGGACRSHRGANVLIRSTWDYVESPARFASWLDHLEAQEARVFNSTGVLRWNMHKRYLIDLDRAGVPTVPTELLESGTEADLGKIMARRGWADVVVKPAVGGTARHTIHLGRTGEAECRRQMAQLLRREDVVIQPFIPTVTTHGELSVVAIAGVPLLAVKKSAARGDWRVQTDFGGRAERTELTEELTTLARAALHGLHRSYGVCPDRRVAIRGRRTPDHRTRAR